MVVAGPQYPTRMQWPENVERIEHVPPQSHRAFYNEQRFTLNLTRREMARAGYAPSVRLFEAAACGRVIITDRWEGLETFFRLGEEILVADSAEDVLEYLKESSALDPIGRRARARVLAEHTAARRAESLETYALELLQG